LTSLDSLLGDWGRDGGFLGISYRNIYFLDTKPPPCFQFFNPVTISSRADPEKEEIGTLRVLWSGATSPKKKKTLNRMTVQI